jgi:hypothetical protein
MREIGRASKGNSGSSVPRSTRGGTRISPSAAAPARRLAGWARAKGSDRIGCDNGFVRLRERNLFDQIERDALAEDVPLASTLRKVIALGGNVGSSKLRDWASRELQGYADVSEDEIPDYRKAPAMIMVDGSNMLARITGQQISRFDLPEEAREHAQERVTFGNGVGELEAMLKQARKDGGARLQIRGGAELAKMMNYRAQQQGIDYQTIERVYHSVSEPNLAGVVDGIRTTLVTLVAEMRAGMVDSAETPTAAVADQAVNVAVHGDKNRIEITSAQASGNGAPNALAGPREKTSGWSTFWVVVGSLAGVAGVAIAVWFTWAGWWS